MSNKVSATLKQNYICLQIFRKLTHSFQTENSNQPYNFQTYKSNILVLSFLIIFFLKSCYRSL